MKAVVSLRVFIETVKEFTPWKFRRTSALKKASLGASG